MSARSDLLVRLSLGLPDPGLTHGEPLADAALRAVLQVDSYSAGERLRLEQAVEARAAVTEQAQEPARREQRETARRR